MLHSVLCYSFTCLYNPNPTLYRADADADEGTLAALEDELDEEEEVSEVKW